MISNKIIAKESFMELVYLWVEGFKNIEKQGFNFSPRFRCEYDEDTKELKIVDKDETGEFYPKNFFGDNINVTAIVGENGSGKSSIQKIFFSIIYYKYVKNLKENYSQNKINDFQLYDSCKEQLFSTNFYSNNFAIIETINGLKKLTISDKYNHLSYEELSYDNLDFFSIHFNYMIDTWNDDNIVDTWIKTIYHRVDGYSNPLLLEPFKGTSEQNINIDNLEYLNTQKILKNMKLIKDIKIARFFSPTTIKYNFAETKLETDRLLKYIDSSKKVNSPFVLAPKVTNKLLTYLEKNYSKENIGHVIQMITHLFEKSIAKDIGFEKDRFLLNNKIYIIIKMLNSNPNNFYEKQYQDIKSFFDNIINSCNPKNIEPLSELFNLDISNLLKKDLPSTIKIKQCINFEQNILDNSENLNKFVNNFGEEINIENINDILDFLPPWLDLEFYQDGKSYKSLSSGEKIFFSFINNLHYQIRNIINSKRYSSINLFLDEVEYGLHPDWQKRFVDEILFALKEYKKNELQINLIFSTHSPFILSDIPKENVIFLEKYKKEDTDVINEIQKIGNCKNATNKINIDTFGANIHTLLSHGFFMKDGLMGEFAKDKISQILFLLSNKIGPINIPIEQIKPIIEIIGEDFLREKFLKMYDEKFKIKSKVDEIKELKAENKELIAEIERLKNAKNNIQ